MPELLRRRAYFKLIWPSFKPRTWRELGHQGLEGVAAWDRELQWHVAAMLPYAGDLAEFLALSAGCDEALLLGDYDRLDGLLNEVDSRFGKSLWYAGRRLGGLRQSTGGAAVRRFAEPITGDAEMSSLWRYAIGWMAFRAETRISAPEFHRLADNSIPRTDGFDLLVRLAIGVYTPLTVENAGGVLTYLDYLPLVDRYELSLAICQAMLAAAPKGSAAKTLRRMLAPLAKGVGDPRLKRLLVMSGASELVPPQAARRGLALFRAYTEAGAAEAAIAAAAAFGQAPSLEAAQLAIRASGEALRADLLEVGAEGCLLREIVACLDRVLNYRPDAGEARNALERICQLHCGCPWSSTILSILARQENDERVFFPRPTQIYHALRAGEENPAFAGILYASDAHHGYLDYLARLDPGSTAIETIRQIFSSTAAWPPALSERRKGRLIALHDIRNRRYDDAIDYLLAAKRTMSFRRSLIEAEALVARTQLAAKRVRSSAASSGYLIADCEEAGRLLPIQELVAAMVEQDEASPPGSHWLGFVAAVVVLAYHSRHVRTDLDHVRADALNDLLAAAGVTRPSDLRIPDDERDQTLMLYFFRHGCVPEALDQCLALENTRAVEDERAEILVRASRLPAAQDGTLSAELAEEVREIRTEQLVRDAARSLDQSKVTVNIEGIKRQLGLPAQEAWRRFRFMAEHSEDLRQLGEAAQAVEQALRGRQSQVIPILAAERDRQFATLLNRIRDAFASSREYGLDVHLSMNIRHGYLERELRGPFVARHLITNMVTRASGYHENKFWLDRLAPEVRPGLSAAFTQFSQTIDRYIEELNRKYIRIRTEKAIHGLFNFDIPASDEQMLARGAVGKEGFDAFLDHIFVYLWQRTERDLVTVRTLLNGETSARLQQALDVLQRTVESTCPGEVKAELCQQIQLARTQAQAAVARVVDWFQIGKSEDHRELPMRIAFDVAIATVESYYPDLDLASGIHASDTLMLTGWGLPHITRILRMLTENAAAYCGMDTGELAIGGRAALEGKYLSLSLTNALSPSVDLVELQATVDRLNADFGHDHAMDRVQQDQGSGYPKIAKILRHDLRRDHKLQVSLEEGRVFKVDISLDATGIAFLGGGTI